MTLNPKAAKIIHKYIPVEGWPQAFLNELIENGFMILSASEAAKMTAINPEPPATSEDAFKMPPE